MRDFIFVLIEAEDSLIKKMQACLDESSELESLFKENESMLTEQRQRGSSRRANAFVLVGLIEAAGLDAFGCLNVSVTVKIGDKSGLSSKVPFNESPLWKEDIKM
jgi:hypothetical protein